LFVLVSSFHIFWLGVLD